MPVGRTTWIALGLVIILIVAGGIAYWWYTRPVTPPTPGEFEFSNLVIEPTEVLEGKTITISVDVTNVGEEDITGSINLLLNGAVEATQEKTLAPGETVTVTFTITKSPGDYTVAVGDLSGTLTILPIFKVAWIMEGVALDESWEQWQYEGALQIDALEDVEVTFAEQVAVADFERIAGDFAEQGYDLIIGTTNDYQEVVLSTAANYPDTYFAIYGAWQFAPNVAGYGVWAHEGGYLAGLLGALISNSSKIGIVGGFQYPSQLVVHNAYRVGRDAGEGIIGKNVTIFETWTGTWWDVSLGREAATAMVDAGVDFITISLSGPGIGAIQIADERGIYAVGAFINQSYMAPDAVIASVVWKSYDPVMTLINAIRAGAFEGKSYDFGMSEGAIDFVWGEVPVPQAIKDEVEQAKQKIISGVLKVPFIPDRLLPLD